MPLLRANAALAECHGIHALKLMGSFMQRIVISLVVLLGAAPLHAASPLEAHFAADPNQKVDTRYGEQIAKYTTDPSFNTQLTDYLPASDTVPTPAKALGEGYDLFA